MISKTGACYTCLNGATVLAEVRSISGFAFAPPFLKFFYVIMFSLILKGLIPIILGDGDCFEVFAV